MLASSSDVNDPGTLDDAPAASSPTSLYLNFAVVDAEVVAALAEYPEGRARNDFAASCLKVGLLALRAARGAIDGDTVRREGDRLIEQLTHKLELYRESLEGNVSSTLTHYFDPTSGRFAERVKSLTSESGELAGLMRAQIQAAQSSLEKTFAAFVGEHSPLLQALSPSDSNALLQALRSTVDSVLQAERATILGQFSLDSPDSALSRLVRDLTKTHGDLTEALEKRMDEVVGEFSLDKEDSALSRLVGRVEQAQRRITNEFSLDSEQSALSRLRREMQTAMEAQARTAADFQEKVIGLLEAMKARKEEAQRSTRHGAEFEATVGEFIQRLAQPAGDVVEACGASTGLISRSKVGDFLVELSHDSAAAGARIVVEAKEDASYTLASTLTECDEARRNRGAGVSLFVHSARTAPAGLAPLTRHGHDIVVVWDPDDERTDVVLQAGLMVAKAISVRAARQSSATAASLTAIDKAIEAIRKQLEGFEEIRTSATTVRNAGEKIEGRARIMADALTRHVEVLMLQMDAIKHAAGDGVG